VSEPPAPRPALSGLPPSAWVLVFGCAAVPVILVAGAIVASLVLDLCHLEWGHMAAPVIAIILSDAVLILVTATSVVLAAIEIVRARRKEARPRLATVASLVMAPALLIPAAWFFAVELGPRAVHAFDRLGNGRPPGSDIHGPGGPAGTLREAPSLPDRNPNAVELRIRPAAPGDTAGMFFLLGGERCDSQAALIAALDRLKKARPGVKVYLFSSPDCGFGGEMKALDACAAAGITDVEFVPAREKGEAAEPKR